MSSGDWAAGREEAHIPGVEWDTGVSEFDDVTLARSVKAAREFGFEPAPEEPIFCFLPAVWPDEARAWVRDTRVRYSLVVCDDGPVQRVPWPTSTYFEIEADMNTTLVECGFDPRPPGRIWLLKPPQVFDSLTPTLNHLNRSAADAGLQIYPHRGFTDHVAAEVQRLFQSSR